MFHLGYPSIVHSPHNEVSTYTLLLSYECWISVGWTVLATLLDMLSQYECFPLDFSSVTCVYASYNAMSVLILLTAL